MKLSPRARSMTAQPAELSQQITKTTINFGPKHVPTATGPKRDRGSKQSASAGYAHSQPRLDVRTRPASLGSRAGLDGQPGLEDPISSVSADQPRLVDSSQPARSGRGGLILENPTPTKHAGGPGGVEVKPPPPWAGDPHWTKGGPRHSTQGRAAVVCRHWPPVVRVSARLQTPGLQLDTEQTY